jgi:hypothetical protein
MKIKTTLTILISLLTSGILYSQETTYKHFPVQVSFVYPIGIHGTRSVSFTYNFSLNVLTGNTGNIDGCEIGGLLNTNQGNISGVQIAGLGNMTKGNVDGLQIGGLFSMADSVEGLQLNGIFSKCGELDGLQISGILNLSTSSQSSIAGIANINTGKQNGIQLAGIYNQTKVLNGVQIGLINIADTIDKGIPIGLVSLVRKGHYDEWSFIIADYLNLGISYKLGVKQFYTIYSVGMNLFEDQLWVAGLGVGHLHEVSPKFSIQPEVIWYTYFPMDFQKHIRYTYVGHFKLGLVRNINDYLAFSFAPSIYLAWKSNRGMYDVYGYDQSPIGPLFDVVPAFSDNKMEFGFGFSLELHY